MTREINIKVVYSLDGILELTPKEKVKEMIEEYFGWDEGFEKIEIEINDK